MRGRAFETDGYVTAASPANNPLTLAPRVRLEPEMFVDKPCSVGQDGKAQFSEVCRRLHYVCFGLMLMNLRHKTLLLMGCLFTVGLTVYAVVSYIPISAVICVPFEHRDIMRAEIQRNGIYATGDQITHFNGQYFRSFPGCGIQIWLSESELLGDATKNGYYCRLEYTTIRGHKWARAVGNPRMIGP